MKSNALELVVACKSWQEAQDIADDLLAKRLVSTAEVMESASRFQRKHAEGHTYTVKVIATTTERNARAAKMAIKHRQNLRRHDHHPPYSVPLSALAREVAKWLKAATDVKSVKLKR